MLVLGCFQKLFILIFTLSNRSTQNQRILFESTEEENNADNAFEIYQLLALSKAIVSVETKVAFHMQNR